MATPPMPSSVIDLCDDVGHLRERVDLRLAQLVPSASGDLLAQALAEALLSPGKRVRPLMLLIAGRELGAREGLLLDLGCVVEMVHAASLVLDDMPCMDDARLRRGRPTLHVRYGEDVAMLVVVALLGEAFRLLASLQDLPPLLRTRMITLLAGAMGRDGLVRGQFQDLRAEPEGRAQDEVSVTNHLKTGALFACALQMAAEAAHAGHEVHEALAECALELGQAFQLCDDLSDGDAADVAGKDSGQDVGKATLVSLLGREAARHRLRLHVQRSEVLLRRCCGAQSALPAFLQRLFERYL